MWLQGKVGNDLSVPEFCVCADLSVVESLRIISSSSPEVNLNVCQATTPQSIVWKWEDS